MQLSPTNGVRRRGFSLIELITAISVIGVLATLAALGYQAAMNTGEVVKETAAAHYAMTAFEAYTAEHNGLLVPGRRAEAHPPKGLEGFAMHGAAGERWFWKLMPYLDMGTESLYVGESERHHSEILSSGGLKSYELTLYPSLGYNGHNIGGDYSNPRISPEDGLLGPGAVVTRYSQAYEPGRLIAFVSAWDSAPAGSDADYVGYWMVEAPRSLNRQWSGGDVPGGRGHVHARHDGRAVVAFLDGHVELLEADELSDMRLWSNPAQKAGDDRYQPSLPNMRR